MQQPIKLSYFLCTWSDADDAAHRQRPCDRWIYDWPDTDFYWLYGSDYTSLQPPPAFSPLARGYYDQITSELNTTISQAIGDCEARRYLAESAPAGLSLRVASRLAAGQIQHADTQQTTGIAASLSVPFTPDAGTGTGNGDPYACTGSTGGGSGGGGTGGGSGGGTGGGGSGGNLPPTVPLELFMEPIDFGYVIYGPAGGNIRWEWRDPPQTLPASDPYFIHYGRTLRLSAGNEHEFLGALHLVIDKLADLWVRFRPHPIPPALASRVDPTQVLHYEVSRGSGYFNIAAAIEVLHLESGQIYSTSIHGNAAPGYLPSDGTWPNNGGWENMSPDADGVIHHYHVDSFYWISTLDPASIGLPTSGTYRMRYILLAYGYQTYARQVTSNALGLGGDTRMSSQPIWLSHMPSLITYTPGMTDGIMPPFEYTYTRSPVLTNGIVFDAVFDLKNLTTFRCVVKIGNYHDFAIGVVVQAAGWQCWVRLEPGEEKYLAGAVSISGMANWDAYPLHPLATLYYGWNNTWSSTYISMYNSQCQIPFRLFLTAPETPETTPSNLPTRKATQRWYWDIAGWDSQYEPVWGAIKQFATDGRYDYEYVLSPYNLSANALASITRSITKPEFQTPLDPASYFMNGYDTATYGLGDPWHKRPWPGPPGSGILTAPIKINGEELIWNGSQNVWVPVSDISLWLTRVMMQQVAALLGVTEYCVMDGDDIRWLQPHPTTGSWHNVLWIDRFYTRGGTLVDETTMRNAFQTVIDSNAGHWPTHRALVIHPAVRFGSFLDNGAGEVGDYLLCENAEFTEVSSLSALSSVSTKFLYHITPSFQ
jgi:hypothetical protein